MSVTDATNAMMQSMQATLSAMTVFSLTDYHFPVGVSLDDKSYYDFVVVGGGTAGSVMASRLTEDGRTTVALIEAGGIPPLESTYIALFPYLPNSAYDWNITSTNDSYANQYLQNNGVGTSVGKMLGGTSSLDHAFHVRGNKYDFNCWAKAAGDDSYKLNNMMKYFKKVETVCDEEILAKYPSYHGINGPIYAKRQKSDKNRKILASFKELGIEIILDINANLTLGYSEPLLHTGKIWRPSAAQTYLGRAKNRRNLFIQLNALVTKIYINSSNIATGVEILTSDGTTKSIYARKEVIISCGAFGSPQLLMLSGIGPRSHLEEFGIKVKADLPVGDNLIDHVGVVVTHTLQKTNTSFLKFNPTEFPLPITTGYVSLDGTKNPTYQSIIAYFPHDFPGLMQQCVWVYKYNNTVCEALYNANVGQDLLYSTINLLHPKSRGTVRLASVDPVADPIVNLRHLSNPEDLENLAKALQDFSGILSTTYFKSIGSKMVEIDLECKNLDPNSFDFWKCYAKWMSISIWQYSSTCAVGKVLDNKMVVKGMRNLRVVDSSAMPYTISGNIILPVYALAEKAADLIKSKWNIKL